jgi:hypothetical protein
MFSRHSGSLEQLTLVQKQSEKMRSVNENVHSLLVTIDFGVYRISEKFCWIKSSPSLATFVLQKILVENIFTNESRWQNWQKFSPGED